MSPGPGTGTATVVVRGVCSGGNDGGTSTNKTQTVTLPAGCIAGDLLILVASSTTGTLTCATPSGFTLVSGPDRNSGNTDTTYVFSKVLTSGDISIGTFSTVWSANGTINLTSGIVLAGASGLGANAVVLNTSQSTTIAMPSVTTGEDNAEIVQIVCTRNTGGVTGQPSAPTGWTQQGSFANAGTGNRMCNYLLTKDAGAAGSYGGETVSVSPSCRIQGYTIEVVPAIAPTTGWQVFDGTAWQPVSAIQVIS